MKKLTLSMEEKDIRAARRVARENGMSISRLFTNYIRLLALKQKEQEQEQEELPPLTRKLTGIIRLPEGKSDRELLEEALMEKYGFDK